MKSIIEEILRKIPPIPEVVEKIKAKIQRADEIDIKSLAREIEKDPVLTTDILRIANSNFFLAVRVASVEHAIVILGLKTLERIIISSWALRLQEEELKGYGYERKKLAMQSLVGAHAGIMISEDVGLRIFYDIIITSSVLRNIGKVFMDFIVLEKRNKIFEFLRKGNPFDVSEKEAIGIDHAELSYIILNHFGFPDEIKIPVRFFRHPSFANGNHTLQKITAVVHVGDIVSQFIETGIDSMMYRFDKKSIEILGISEERIFEVYKNILSRVDEIKREFLI